MRLATWVKQAKPSYIREILKFTQQPGVISFAGGMPAPDLFPVAEIQQAYQQALEQHAAKLLQYSPSEGERELRDAIAKRLTQKDLAVNGDAVLITNGSQQALDLIAKSLLRPGDVVLVESPTYLGAIQAFTPYHPLLVSVDSDEQGMLPDGLAEAVRLHRPKFVYLVPTFQNPTGRTMGLARRQAIVDVCRELSVPIVEDDPYSDLRFTGTHVPPLQSLWDGVIYVGSLSKTLAPGLRLGWIVAPADLFNALLLGMQATTLNVNALSQWVAADLIANERYDAHLLQLRSVYHERMRVMTDAMERVFPSDCQWTTPEGGLFLWMTLPDRFSAVALTEAAMEVGVAMVPGYPFYVDRQSDSTLRLNFSNAKPAKILEGIERIGEAMQHLGWTGRMHRVPV